MKKWLDRNIDKVAHTFVSFFLVFFFEIILRRLVGYDQPVPLGTSIAFFCGLGKELYDEYTGGRIDWKDLVANAIGLILANIYFYDLYISGAS